MITLDIPLPAAVGILFFLLLASAFFSGSETALTRARRVRLKALGEKGNRGARRADQLLRHPDRMLSAILLGNNFVNIAASALATALFVAEFGEAGILYATIAMTVVVLVFSEILPKTIAVAHAEAISCRIAAPLQWVQRLLTPVTALLMAIIGLLQRLFRVPEGTETALSHHELATLIDISAESGVLDQAREQMLMSSLHLHEVPVKALMTPRKDMVVLDASQSVADCLAQMAASPHSRCPVHHGAPDQLIGIVHLRDLIRCANSDARLVDTMIWQEPPYIPSSKNALAQLFDFQAKRQHMAIVVDEFGDIDGLITLEDIIEEIVGEIVDESDIPLPPKMWPQPDGSLVTSATVSLHDINQTFDSDLPEEGATTIGGLIVHTLGHQPEDRLCLSINHVRIEILSLSGDWIQRVKLCKVENHRAEKD
ncbi:MAG: CNNM domain-containing protein [Mariprofundaceae bacterium]|nr:CNNM domain-containing protein [Mariprofundaceae bacterium]